MAQMTQPSRRNGGRPRVPPEWHTVRRTITIRPVDLAYLKVIDDNLSVAIRKMIAMQTAPAVPHKQGKRRFV